MPTFVPDECPMALYSLNRILTLKYYCYEKELITTVCNADVSHVR